MRLIFKYANWVTKYLIKVYYVLCLPYLSNINFSTLVIIPKATYQTNIYVEKDH